MITHIISFLIMLNPFAMFLYLRPVMKELDDKTFYHVLGKASAISFITFTVFLISGKYIFENIFNIHFESFRIFGGIILFSLSYVFIINGRKALIQLRADLDDLASEIALPFMVGAGTISLTVVMAHELSKIEGAIALALIVSLNFITIYGLKEVRDNIRKKDFQIAFDKNMEILLRLNGFLLGAIGINMIIEGIQNVGLM